MYENDFHSISDTDRKTWEHLQEKEIVYRNGKPTLARISRYRQYPKSVRHFLSLFPNNFVDAVDLIENKANLKTVLEEFRILCDTPGISERSILNFIRDKRAYFLIGSILKKYYSFGHHALFLFPEFKMPPNYQADFVIVGKNSDGHHFVFIELENPAGDITVQDGSFGTTLRKGIKQIDDWEFWLEQNFSNLKPVFEGVRNKNLLLPDEFRSFDKTRFHYVVVAGRRKDFSERTYRLRRSNVEQRKLLVLHYDNLMDSALEVIGAPTY